jgi:hypothetical protein
MAPVSKNFGPQNCGAVPRTEVFLPLTINLACQLLGPVVNYFESCT